LGKKMMQKSENIEKSNFVKGLGVTYDQKISISRADAVKKR